MACDSRDAAGGVAEEEITSTTIPGKHSTNEFPQAEKPNTCM